MATWQEALEWLLDPMGSPFAMIETLGIRPSRLRELLASKRLQGTLAVMQEVAMLRARHRAACGAPVAMERLIELSANSQRETTALRASQAVYRAAERAQAWREEMASGKVRRRRRSTGGGGSAGDDVAIRDNAAGQATPARSGPRRSARRAVADGPPLKVILPSAAGPGEAASAQAGAVAVGEGAAGDATRPTANGRNTGRKRPVPPNTVPPNAVPPNTVPPETVPPETVASGAAKVDAVFFKEARRCRCLELKMYWRAKQFPDLVAEGLTQRLVVTEDTPLAAWEIAAEEGSQGEGPPPEAPPEVPPAAWESTAEADSSPDSPPEGAAERETEPIEQTSGDDVAIGGSAAGEAARTTAEDDVAIPDESGLATPPRRWRIFANLCETLRFVPVRPARIFSLSKAIAMTYVRTPRRPASPRRMVKKFASPRGAKELAPRCPRD